MSEPAGSDPMGSDPAAPGSADSGPVGFDPVSGPASSDWADPNSAGSDSLDPDVLDEATEFLISFGNLMSIAGLYRKEHPARRRSLDRCWSQLQVLMMRGTPVFSFLEDVVLFGPQLMPHLRSWDLGVRLYKAGIERIEFQGGLEREELAELGEYLHSKLTGSDSRSTEEAGEALPHVQFGAVALRADSNRDAAAAEVAALACLDDEVEVVGWIFDEIAESDRIPAAEVSLAVASFSSAMANLQRYGAGMIAIKNHDEYTAIHCINVALLSMAFAEHLGFSPDEIRLIGEASLLHDIGKTKTPNEVLNKPGRLTSEERKVVEEHAVNGARLALEPPFSHWLAATVAYEHHMSNTEQGYPKTQYEREPHPVSRLVQVCDVYDALRTRRPFRDPKSAEDTIKLLKDWAGGHLHAGLVKQFLEMVRSPKFDVPHVSPDVEFADAFERESVHAGHLAAGAWSANGAPSESSAPNPSAVIDWLGVL